MSVVLCISRITWPRPWPPRRRLISEAMPRPKSIFPTRSQIHSAIFLFLNVTTIIFRSDNNAQPRDIARRRHLYRTKGSVTDAEIASRRGTMASRRDISREVPVTCDTRPLLGRRPGCATRERCRVVFACAAEYDASGCATLRVYCRISRTRLAAEAV